MARKRSLQKFTETENKIENLLLLEKITKEDLKGFDNVERQHLGFVISQKLNVLQGFERDDLFRKVEDILEQEGKNQLWEQNHFNIMWAISNLTNEYGNLPPVNVIAEKIGLSRTTIYKHLTDFKNHTSYKKQQEIMEAMADKITWQMFTLANKGDTKAARLFLEVAGKLGKGNQMQNIKNQNNYIQINGMTFNEQQINALSPEKLKQIETILTTANWEQPLFEDCEISGIKGNV